MAFMKKKWDYKQCHKYTIFLSQGQYPIKGLHQMVKALPLILRDYPDTKVYVAGNDFFSDVPFWRKKWLCQLCSETDEKVRCG